MKMLRTVFCALGLGLVTIAANAAPIISPTINPDDFPSFEGVCDTKLAAVISDGYRRAEVVRNKARIVTEQNSAGKLNLICDSSGKVTAFTSDPALGDGRVLVEDLNDGVAIVFLLQSGTVLGVVPTYSTMLDYHQVAKHTLLEKLENIDRRESRMIFSALSSGGKVKLSKFGLEIPFGDNDFEAAPACVEYCDQVYTNTMEFCEAMLDYSGDTPQPVTPAVKLACKNGAAAERYTCKRAC
jgi:hypothetical protein